jgi:hypothetical protein
MVMTKYHVNMRLYKLAKEETCHQFSVTQNINRNPNDQIPLHTVALNKTERVSKLSIKLAE